MPNFRSATVAALGSARPGLQRLDVEMSDGSRARAYALTSLTGPCAVGDRVVLNTTAVDLGLGTGGWHVVHWNLERGELLQPGPDHVMKVRYTSLQHDAGTSELRHPECDQPLGGTPVVVGSVHSQLAPVAAAFAEAAPGRRLVHVMTDGAALPLALSDLSAQLVSQGLVAATVTAGHAFGGDLEAVNVHSALGLAVHVLGADAVVVVMGPGVVGTGTSLGTTAVEVAPALDAADALGGRPVLCVRASEGDGRERHRGVSHHTVTAARLCRTRPFVVDVPVGAGDLPGVQPLEVLDLPDPAALLARHGLDRTTTMGRTVAEDPLFFAAAAAAGAGAAVLLDRP
ncbi:MAG: DUF3866 family protein [Actinomycetes bacterium]